MMNMLERVAREKSTFEVTVSFFDQASAPMTPTTATWSLMKSDGTIINSRENVALTPATSVTITLKGADLAIGEDEEGEEVLRVITIKTTYSSGTKPYNDSVKLPLRALLGVA